LIICSSCYSTFQEGLLLARGFVVGVLAQVAELAGGLDAGDHLGTAARRQLLQLGA
jgi:hypothetical protein